MSGEYTCSQFLAAIEPVSVHSREQVMPQIFAAAFPSPSSSADRRARALKVHGRRVLLAILILLAILLALAFLPDYAQAAGL
jgi:hypothetical protein